MVFKGVLSDISIKENYPEYFPMDIGKQEAMFPDRLNIPKFNKSSLDVQCYRSHPRYPINDIKNFASLTTPQNATVAGFENILRYRQKIGSSNIPNNINDGYETQKESSYEARLPKAITPVPLVLSGTTTSGTLSLGQTQRIKGENNLTIFNRMFKNQYPYLERDTRATLMNLGDEADIRRVLNNVFFNPPLRGSTIPHKEALRMLRDEYKTNPQDLVALDRAAQAAKTRDLPDVSDFGGRIVDAFSHYFSPSSAAASSSNPFSNLPVEGDDDDD